METNQTKHGLKYLANDVIIRSGTLLKGNVKHPSETELLSAITATRLTSGCVTSASQFILHSSCIPGQTLWAWSLTLRDPQHPTPYVYFADCTRFHICRQVEDRTKPVYRTLHEPLPYEPERLALSGVRRAYGMWVKVDQNLPPLRFDPDRPTDREIVARAIVSFLSRFCSTDGVGKG